MGSENCQIGMKRLPMEEKLRYSASKDLHTMVGAVGVMVGRAVGPSVGACTADINQAIRSLKMTPFDMMALLTRPPD
jgi:hypothetical protein